MLVACRSVSAGYGSFRALFDVSLEVRHGEAVGVIGPNGAGKTTLMRVDLRAGADRAAARCARWAPARRPAGASHRRAAASPTCRRTAGCFRDSPSRKICASAPSSRRPAGASPSSSRTGVRAFPAPQGPPRPARRHALRRRAADVRDRPRADVATEAAVDGRAFGRAGAAGRRSRCSTSSGASAPRGYRADRRAERAAGARRRRPRLSARGRHASSSPARRPSSRTTTSSARPIWGL